jgi:hypothetical protein
MRMERVAGPADGRAKDGVGRSSTCGSEGVRGRRDVRMVALLSQTRRRVWRLLVIVATNVVAAEAARGRTCRRRAADGKEEDDRVYEDQTSD